jgi:uncharacterized protein YkwD
VSQQTSHSSARASVRSRRRVALLGLLLGVGVLVPNASVSTAAEPEPEVVVGRLSGNELIPASRGGSVVVAAPEPEVISNEVHAAEVVAKTNAERRAVGLPPLQRNSKLDIAAAAHANDQRNVPCLRGYLTHTGTDGSKGVDRILRTGLDISRWGENIACAHQSSTSVMRGWMNSPGHRANILHTDFTHIGVSVASSDTGVLYWVQTFATLR